MGPLRTTLFGALLLVGLVFGTSPSFHSGGFLVATGLVVRPADPEPFVPTISDPDLTNCPSGLVALTFDDGPHPKFTPKLLDILRANQAPATFFVVGYRLKANPEIAQQAYLDGHLVQNHSWSHPNFYLLSVARINEQMKKTSKLIEQTTGEEPVLMRPPYGINPKKVHVQARKNAMSVALWEIDTEDWRTGRSAKGITNTALKKLRKNKLNVILLHDGVRNSGETIKAVPKIISGVRERGYCLVRMDQTGPQANLAIADVSVIRGEQTESQVEVTLTLDTRTRRTTSVVLTPISDTAYRDEDFKSEPIQVIIPAGKQQAKASVTIYADPSSNRAESFTLRLEHARGLVIPKQSPRITLLEE